ncbi:UDP-glucose/GDP-mannose dehydrogenase family protein [Candidatus Uhrbacteria bacterium]|nr:UDP-glucose/GDP-mannose dehydrogenase family protein [Candidatus Uhrbacteria bacterium]
MTIAVVGTGYVGLTAGVCLSHFGNTVACFDIQEKKIERLSAGECIIYESGLEELLKKGLASGNLIFTTDPARAVQRADIIFFSVDTPAGEYGKADLSRLLAAVKNCAQYMKPGAVFVNKSTAPVGTVQKMKEAIREVIGDTDFSVASNPEFLSEGNAVQDFLHPDRIVIGVEDARAEQMLRAAYAPIIGDDHPLVVTTIPSAELIKYSANAFLALKISFMNEIADFCEVCGADVKEIARGMGFDRRIGKYFLRAGIGYGGSCFGKDVSALAMSAEEHGYEFKIIKALSQVNTLRYQIILKKLQKHLPDMKGKRIAVCGLAYKPMTDDVRDAPAHRIIFELLSLGARVSVYDPAANESFYATFSHAAQVHFAGSAYAALGDADALIILTEWDEFRNFDLSKVKQLMKGGVIIDGRNIFERRDVEHAGFIYEGIGR